MPTMGPAGAVDSQQLAGNLLRLARQRREISQRQLAIAAGVPQSTVARIETHRQQPTLPLLARLLAAAGLELRTRLEEYDPHDDVLDARRASTTPGQRRKANQTRSRFAAEPLDADRVELFTRFAGWLVDQPPNLFIDDPGLSDRRRLVPFYEAYFSNVIEGIDFTLGEAVDLLIERHTPTHRTADARDLLGTYEIVSDSTEMSRLPGESDELLEMLATRHRMVMAGRPEKMPGEFKRRANRVGQTIFVAPDLVVGTLRAGFEQYQGLTDPFARAVFIMFLLAEVHPFTDGNGRIARIFMNAELVATRQVRLIIPTVYRDDYLAGLRAVTRTRQFPALYRVLDYARRYTAAVDFTSRASAENDFERTNALLDPREADRNGLRLQLPPRPTVL